MSTSVPQPDGGAMSGTNDSSTPYLGDESVLRRVFDAQYETLLAGARSQLGDAASQGTRIVEAAFIGAWAKRGSLQSADQVDAFLTDEVKHGSSRALSRRAAAQRFGTHGGRDTTNTGQHAAGAESASVDESWANIDRAIHQAASGADAHAAVASAGRHDTAAHMKKVGRGQSWVGIVVAGVIAIAVAVAAVVFTSRLGEEEAAFSAVNSPAITPVESSPGQIGTVTLNDGTKMRMGPQTRFMKPEDFPGKLRAVKVDGTAQFDVAPGQVLPFRVIAKRTQIIATGTSFAVSSYASDSGVMVFVKEGTVTVKSGKMTATAAANQALLIDHDTSRMLTDAEKADAFGWLDGRVVVTHKPLRYALAQLVRWFNLDIKVPDLTLLDRDASLNVSLDSSLVAITQIEKSANVKFGYEGENKLFRDATSKK
jgi:transmembrane sensor